MTRAERRAIAQKVRAAEQLYDALHAMLQVAPLDKPLDEVAAEAYGQGIRALAAANGASPEQLTRKMAALDRLDAWRAGKFCRAQQSGLGTEKGKTGEFSPKELS